MPMQTVHNIYDNMKRYRHIIFLAISLLCLAMTESRAFNIRAAYLDFRTQVMTLPAMKAFAKDAADRGLNAIVVEYEATFPFKDNLTLRNRYAFSESEINDFIGYCSGIGIEVIPLQNCFGHAEYILMHGRYAGLKENRRDCSQVCPCKSEDAEKVFRSIFGEIAALHPSEYMHIGCDETRLLGNCRQCHKVVAEEGISRLYVDYVSRMCNIVTELGKTPMIWADILLRHPEALPSLPENVIVVDWNYGWKPDHFGKMENIEKSGHEIWGASSLRSHPDNLYLVQWRKHLDNIFEYSSYAEKHGFKGFINTSWSTSGTYGYIYDDNDEVVAIQPVREVYPQTGFSMLDDAFASAMSGKHKDADTFLDDWCRTVLGLTEDDDIAAVKAYFNMKQNPVYTFNGKDGRIDREIEKCLQVMKGFSAVKFSGDAKMTARHLDLMLRIRINYLKFKAVESKIESSGFNHGNQEAMLRELTGIASECRKLQKTFISLNKGYLKDPEKSFNEWTYYGKIQNLISVLENI